MMQHRSPNNGRFDALDTLRFLAVLVMVQGHAFYVTLTQADRLAPWYSWHNYVHGYTAPAFLFGAGLAFGYTTLTDRVDSHGKPGPTLYKRLYRYLSLFAIGYAIQLPPLAVATAHWSPESVRVFLRVEALQHIGAALLLVQLLVVWLRRPLPVVLSTLAIGATVVLIAPALSRLPPSYWGSEALAAYLSLDVGSTFPLVPWAGFVMAGVGVGALVFHQRKVRGPLTISLGFLASGGALVALSLWLDRAFPGAFGEHFYWKASPYFFLRRLGWVVATLGLLALLDCALALRPGVAGATRRWIRLISQHSLVVYVAHLVLLYGSPFSPGLRNALWQRLGLLGSSAVVLGLFAALAALLVLWEAIDQRHDQGFLRFRRVSVGVMAAASLVAAARTASYVIPGAVEEPVMADLSQTPAPADQSTDPEIDEERVDATPALSPAGSAALSVLK